MKKQSFEDMLDRLAVINGELESGNAGLESSIELFKEGTKLVGELTKLLDKAELEIKELVPASEED